MREKYCFELSSRGKLAAWQTRHPVPKPPPSVAMTGLLLSAVPWSEHPSARQGFVKGDDGRRCSGHPSSLVWVLCCFAGAEGRCSCLQARCISWTWCKLLLEAPYSSVFCIKALPWFFILWH